MIQPQVVKKKRPARKICAYCELSYPGDDFILVKHWFYPDGLAPVCNHCIKRKLSEAQWNWVAIDKLCQILDIPFIPAEFERLKEINGDNAFPIYAKSMSGDEFENIGWADYYEKFKELKELKLIEHELPEIHEAKIKELQKTWGPNYEEESLFYLENLYNGMLASQNISGALQADQARKLCKMSLEIDARIRAGLDFDKLMGSYDKMVKTAEFTPKNVRNENDFDTFAEVALWLERRGWVNKGFDDVSRDVVDELIQNYQTFVQRLYTHESNISEEVEERLAALKIAENIKGPIKAEDVYGLDISHDLEQYENQGYNELIKEEFILDDDEGGELL